MYYFVSVLNKKLIVTMVILALLSGAIFYLKSHYVPASNGINYVAGDSEIRDIQWERSISTTTQLSLEIPKEWRLVEDMQSAVDGVNVPVLLITPPESELILTPKAGTNNLIHIYTQFRLMHPRESVVISETDFFSYWRSELEKNAGLDGYRVYGIGDKYWGLNGISRVEDTSVMMSQALCQENMHRRCEQIFVHILSSIRKANTSK